MSKSLLNPFSPNILAIDHFVGNKKITKRIFLFTSGEGKTECDIQKLGRVINSANLADVRITVTTLDFMLDYNPLDDQINYADNPDQSEK